jgi:hypothetical protein
MMIGHRKMSRWTWLERVDEASIVSSSVCLELWSQVACLSCLVPPALPTVCLMYSSVVIFEYLHRMSPSEGARVRLPREVVTVHKSLVWCGVVWWGVMWCGVVWCGVVWCGVVTLTLTLTLL